MLDAKDVSVLLLHETRSTLLGNFLSQLSTRIAQHLHVLVLNYNPVQSRELYILFYSCLIEFVCDSAVLYNFLCILDKA